MNNSSQKSSETKITLDPLLGTVFLAAAAYLLGETADAEITKMVQNSKVIDAYVFEENKKINFSQWLAYKEEAKEQKSVQVVEKQKEESKIVAPVEAEPEISFAGLF